MGKAPLAGMGGLSFVFSIVGPFGWLGVVRLELNSLVRGTFHTVLDSYCCMCNWLTIAVKDT